MRDRKTTVSCFARDAALHCGPQREALGMAFPAVAALAGEAVSIWLATGSGAIELSPGAAVAAAVLGGAGADPGSENAHCWTSVQVESLRL
jgi:hypothetical protein